MVAHTIVSPVDRPFGAPFETVLHLPAPPSVNDLWTPVNSRMVASAAYKAWVKAADAAVMLAGGVKRFGKMPDKFEAVVTLDEDSVGLDLDNSPKALIDYCRRIELIKNDNKKYMRRITAQWGEVPAGCKVMLRSVI